jgi:D-3-phosphoglycerate dehydrogenase
MSIGKVLLTDYAWPDLQIEKAILDKHQIELVVADSTDVATLKRLAADVDGIMTNWAQTTAEVIGASGKCRIVARMGIGLDNIDVAYCTAQKIPVTNVPDYCVIEVAEHALALLLASARNIGFFHYETKQGKYDLQAGPQMRRLEGQTLGVFGLGNIGLALARKAIGLGMRVLATTRSGQQTQEGIEMVALDRLLAESDFVSLHAPLTEQTRYLFAAEQFAAMKRTAYLINTSRGPLIDHEALWQALQSNQIAGAALDVHDPEPADLSRPLFRDPRVIVTPHAAFVSQESLANLRQRAAQQVADRLTGKSPENVRNPQVLHS